MFLFLESFQWKGCVVMGSTVTRTLLVHSLMTDASFIFSHPTFQCVYVSFSCVLKILRSLPSLDLHESWEDAQCFCDAGGGTVPPPSPRGVRVPGPKLQHDTRHLVTSGEWVPAVWPVGAGDMDQSTLVTGWGKAVCSTLPLSMYRQYDMVPECGAVKPRPWLRSLVSPDTNTRTN